MNKINKIALISTLVIGGSSFITSCSDNRINPKDLSFVKEVAKNNNYSIETLKNNEFYSSGIFNPKYIGITTEDSNLGGFIELEDGVCSFEVIDGEVIVGAKLNEYETVYDSEKLNYSLNNFDLTAFTYDENTDTYSTDSKVNKIAYLNLIDVETQNYLVNAKELILEIKNNSFDLILESGNDKFVTSFYDINQSNDILLDEALTELHCYNKEENLELENALELFKNHNYTQELYLNDKNGNKIIYGDAIFTENYYNVDIDIKYYDTIIQESQGTAHQGYIRLEKETTVKALQGEGERIIKPGIYAFSTYIYDSNNPEADVTRGMYYYYQNGTTELELYESMSYPSLAGIFNGFSYYLKEDNNGIYKTSNRVLALDLADKLAVATLILQSGYEIFDAYIDVNGYNSSNPNESVIKLGVTYGINSGDNTYEYKFTDFNISKDQLVEDYFYNGIDVNNK